MNTNKTTIEISATNKTDQAFRQVKGRLQEMDTAAKGITGRLSSISAAAGSIGLAFSAGAALQLTSSLMAISKASIDAADQLNKMRQKVGMSAEDLSKLQYAAKLADVSNEQLGKGLTILNKNMLEAVSGSKEQQAAFRALLGENYKMIISGKDTGQVFKLIAERLSGLPDGYVKTALAQKMFGKSGANLIPLLNAGAKGIEETGRQAERLGIVVSTQTAIAAEQFNDNMFALTQVSKGFANTVTAEILPSLVSLTDKLITLVQSDGWREFWGSMAGRGIKGGWLAAINPLYGAVKSLAAGDFRGAIAMANPALAAIHGMLNKPQIPDFSGKKMPMPARPAAQGKVDETLSTYVNSLNSEKRDAELRRAAAEAKRRAEQIAKDTDSINDTIAKNTMDSFALQHRELDKMVAEFKKAGVMEVDIARYKASETARIEKEWLEEVGKYRTDDLTAFSKKVAEALTMEDQLREASLRGRIADTDMDRTFRVGSEAENIALQIGNYRQLLDLELQRADSMKALDDVSGWISQQDAIRQTRQELLQLEKDQLRYTGDTLDGLIDGMSQYASQLPPVFEAAGDLAFNTLQGMEDALVDFVTTGKMEFSDLTDSILKDIARMTVQKTITGPLSNLLSNSLSSLFGGGTSSSYNPLWALEGYATGTDYVPRTGPYLLHKGEAVITAADNAIRRSSGGDSGGQSLNISVPVTVNGSNWDSRGLRDEIETVVHRWVGRHS